MVEGILIKILKVDPAVNLPGKLKIIDWINPFNRLNINNKKKNRL